MRNLVVGMLLGATLGTVGAAVGAAPAPRAEPCAPGAQQARAAAPRQPTAARTKAAPAKKASGIVFVGNDTWEVPEALVDRYVSDPDALSGQAGARQAPKGWKLTSVKAGSKVDQLGFEEGDVITAVNGYGLGSLTSTWWASTQLKNEDFYRVTIKRDGATKTLKYRVAD